MGGSGSGGGVGVGVDGDKWKDKRNQRLATKKVIKITMNPMTLLEATIMAAIK